MERNPDRSGENAPAPARELLAAAGYREDRAGRHVLSLGVLSSYADVSHDHFTWFELSLKKSRWSSATYRVNPDDYLPQEGDPIVLTDRDARAALVGLVAGQVQARRLGKGLELLVPRANGWELVSEVRGGFLNDVTLEQVGDLAGFVDVRTLGDSLPQ